MKKIISLSLLVITLLTCVLGLSSCGFQSHPVGYLKDSTGKAYITGDSTLGFDGYRGKFDTQQFTDGDSAADALLDGKIEFLLVDRSVAIAVLSEHAPLKAVSKPLASPAGLEELVILTKADNTVFDACTTEDAVKETFDGLKKSDFQIEWELFYDKFITHKGYEEVLTGLQTTMIIAIVGLLIGILIGTVIALIKMIPKYHVAPRILSAICDVYVGFFRGTPMVVQLLIGWFILLPALDLQVENIVVAAAVFGMNSGAYVSEIMRSGIQAVDVGQLEAARAVGLGYWTSMMKIVIPQGIKNILPTLGNEFIILVKDTSIVSFIAVVDVTKAFRQIGDANYSYTIPYLMLALVYLVIVMIITYLVKLMERRLAKSERRK
ncbi:MAG: amino acid ABC transporter permease [Ruminococcaceae bacterium]|nr:amino acid ABC transporter permease [Oscillospiraceae bacterium]